MIVIDPSKSLSWVIYFENTVLRYLQTEISWHILVGYIVGFYANGFSINTVLINDNCCLVLTSYVFDIILSMYGNRIEYFNFYLIAFILSHNNNSKLVFHTTHSIRIKYI